MHHLFSLHYIKYFATSKEANSFAEMLKKSSDNLGFSRPLIVKVSEIESICYMYMSNPKEVSISAYLYPKNEKIL